MIFGGGGGGGGFLWEPCAAFASFFAGRWQCYAVNTTTVCAPLCSKCKQQTRKKANSIEVVPFARGKDGTVKLQKEQWVQKIHSSDVMGNEALQVATPECSVPIRRYCDGSRRGMNSKRITLEIQCPVTACMIW